MTVKIVCLLFSKEVKKTNSTGVFFKFYFVIFLYGMLELKYELHKYLLFRRT